MPDIQTHPLTLIPDPTLTTPTHKVTDPLAEEIQKLIPEMFATMTKERGVGLAATQVGRGLRLAVIDADGMQFTIINPEIIARSEERVIFTEGCLSIPGKEFDIVRHEKIVVRYLDETGKQCKIKLRGFLAIVFQHEIDHLDGTVIAAKYNAQEKLRRENDFTNVTNMWR